MRRLGRAERDKNDMGQGRSAWAAGTFMSVACLLASGVPAAAQLGEKSVKTIMGYAWEQTPDKFTQMSGKTIFIDKKNPEKVMVSVDKGRQIIEAGFRTARAQVCDLYEDQVRNYYSLMMRAQTQFSLTPQQLIYANQLHQITVFLTIGKVEQVIQEDGKKQLRIIPGKAKVSTCSEEERERLKQAIDAYVKAGPDITAALNAATVQAGSPRKTGATPKPEKKN